MKIDRAGLKAIIREVVEEVFSEAFSRPVAPAVGLAEKRQLASATRKPTVQGTQSRATSQPLARVQGELKREIAAAVPKGPLQSILAETIMSPEFQQQLATIPEAADGPVDESAQYDAWAAMAFDAPPSRRK